MRSPALRVALTGGIASGKSRCLAALRALGVPTIDADQLARAVVALGSDGLQRVVDRFGSAILRPDGELDREALGGIVFADTGARRDLEAIIHPAVQSAIDTWFADLDAPAGVADIPLLFETGRAPAFDVVLVAACTPEQQRMRLKARDGLSAADAAARLAAQLPLEDKVAQADHVIDTSGTLEQTDANTAAVWRQVVSRATRRP